MNYKNASHILPDDLLKEVQKYAAGEAIYVPKLEERKNWGTKSGARGYYEERNYKIRKAYAEGVSMEELADLYVLSYESIRKIVYCTSKTGI